MDISFIIVNWNAIKYLSQCIASIVENSQSFSYEIIVVDNASSDGSPDIIKNQFPDIKVICNGSNLGFAKANNIGIRQSQGDFLCLVNSDVVVLKDSVDKLLAYIKSQPTIGMVGPQIIGIKGEIQRSCMEHPTLSNMFARAIAFNSVFPKSKLLGNYLMTDWEHDSLRRVDIINGCFWLIRKKALDKVGLLDEQFFMYGEDMDWCKRFWNNHWEISFYPDVKVIHYGGASSANAPVRFYIEMHKANLKYWEKHHGAFSLYIFRCILLLHQFIRLFGYLIRVISSPSKFSKDKVKIHRSFISILFLLNIPITNKTYNVASH